MWPKHYPEGCPPEDAQDANGRFYRLIEGQEPKPEDFVPAYAKEPNRTWGAKFCQACGLSLFREVADLKRLLNRVKAMKNKATAVATLEPKHGKVKPTPGAIPDSSHHTWWVPEGVEVAPLFELANGEGLANTKGEND